MPLGIARHNSLSRLIAAAVASRTPKTFTTSNITYDGSSQFGSYSASFNGSSSKAYAANNSDFNLSNNAYTIEFWFKTTDTVAEIVNQQNYGDNIGWSVGVRSSQRMLFAAGSNTEISVLVPATGGWTDNTWAHVAVCHQAGGGVAIFANGVRKYYNSGWNVNIYDATQAFYIGTGYGVSSGLFSDPSDGGSRGGYFYNGLLDELRISTVDRYGVGNSTITVPTESFTNDADTILLMHFENNFNDDGGPQ